MPADVPYPLRARGHVLDGQQKVSAFLPKSSPRSVAYAGASRAHPSPLVPCRVFKELKGDGKLKRAPQAGYFEALALSSKVSRCAPQVGGRGCCVLIHTGSVKRARVSGVVDAQPALPPLRTALAHAPLVAAAIDPACLAGPAGESPAFAKSAGAAHCSRWHGQWKCCCAQRLVVQTTAVQMTMKRCAPRDLFVRAP